MPEDIKSSETYDFVHENGVLEITANYIGKDSLIDILKTALKRDFDLLFDKFEDDKSSDIRLN